MNKISIFLVAMVMCASAYAQLTYGVKAGLNVSRMVYQVYDDSTSAMGFLPSFHVGMYGGFDFSDKFSVTADFLISDKGCKEAYAAHLLYASIPVLMQYKIKKISLGVGPSVGILITSWGKERDNLKEMYNNPIDLGVIAGIQYEFTSSIVLSFRFEQGLSNVIGKDAVLPYYKYINENDPLIIDMNMRENGFKFRNQCFQLSLCYRLSHH
jgi:hypothetical protein